jgi:hypothetical protein
VPGKGAEGIFSPEARTSRTRATFSSVATLSTVVRKESKVIGFSAR